MILELTMVVLLFHLVLGIVLWIRVKDLNQYPNVLGIPIIGNLYYFYRGLLPCNFNQRVIYVNNIIDKCGEDIAFTFQYGKRAVIVSCPHLMEKIAHNTYITEKPTCVYGPLNGIINGIFSHCRADNEWKTRRKEMNICMTKTRIEGTYHDVFVRLGKDLVQDLESSHSKKFYISNYINIIGIKAIIGTLCGLKDVSVSHKIGLIMEFFGQTATFALANPIIGFIYNLMIRIPEILIMIRSKFLKKQVFGDISEKLKKIEQHQIEDYNNLPLSLMISLRNKKRKQAFTEWKKELNELVIVGSHTVSSTMKCALHCLATQPEIQDKAWKEQLEIFGTDTRDPTVEDIQKMFYLERFLKETLRFFSPPLISKWTTGEVNMGGAIVPAGTLVLIPLFKMRMDPRYWKNPERFDPDRFLENGDRPKYSFMPFGIGIRGCLGMEFAKQEIKVVLSGLLRRFKISSTQKFEDLKFNFSVMVEIANLTKLQVEKRK